VAGPLNAGFVCYADDCDEMDPRVRAMGLAHMPHARSLPFVILTDAAGRLVAELTGVETHLLPS
jgi:hypothetical protein